MLRFCFDFFTCLLVFCCYVYVLQFQTETCVVVFAIGEQADQTECIDWQLGIGNSGKSL